MGCETIVYVRKKQNLEDGNVQGVNPNGPEAGKGKIDESVWDDDKLGCMLFFQYKTPSLELEVLPFTYECPMPLTKVLVSEAIAFYNDKIKEFEKDISNWKEKLRLVEQRIVKATPELYDQISEESDSCLEFIHEIEKDINRYKFQKSRFEFVFGMLDDMHPDYEIIYCKG